MFRTNVNPQNVASDWVSIAYKQLGDLWATCASPKSTLIQCERVTWGRGLGIDQKLTNSRNLIEWASQGAKNWPPFGNFGRSLGNL